MKSRYHNISAAVFLIIIILLSCACQKGRTQDKYIEGNIKITEEELKATLGNLPFGIADNILQDTTVFLNYIEQLLIIDNNDKNFLFYPVDKKRYLPEYFIPDDLASLDSNGFLVNKKGMQLREPAMLALKGLRDTAKDNNLKLLVSSAYRSYDYQKNLYNYYIGIYGKEKTDTFSAPPGSSQHQLGTVADFGSISLEFKDTPEGKWITENAWKFGFSLSFPEGFEAETGYDYEPWHFRYITRTGTECEKLFFNGLQYVFLDYFNQYKDFFKQKLVLN